MCSHQTDPEALRKLEKHISDLAASH
eukprot:SAG11_NODE_7097_length_1194_cov_1.200913_3_plen_25_part_01